MTSSKKRAGSQLVPRTMKKTTRKTVTTSNKPVESAFHQSSSRDHVKKMTVEIDRDLHTKLKVIAAHQGLTIREIIESYLEEYVRTNT